MYKSKRSFIKLNLVTFVAVIFILAALAVPVLL